MEAKSYLDLLPEEIWQRVNRIVRAHPTFAMIMDLPYEVRMYIVVQMPYPDVLRFCATSKTAKNVCDDDYFWKLKVEHDFPNEMKYIVEELHQGKWHKKYQKKWKNAQKMLFDLIDNIWRYHSKNVTKRVNSLLQLGIDPNIQNKSGETPLEVASWNGDADIVRLLLEYGADPKSGSALTGASIEGHADVVRLLLDHGADPNIQDEGGVASLIYASIEGRADVVRLLLDHGADPNIQDEEGMAPLDWASRAGHTEIVRLLSE